MRRLLLSICCLWTGMTLNGWAAEQPMSFNQRIRPLLSAHCFSCHGPDAASRKADLRLDTRAGALAGSAVVPGEPDQSELIQRINSTDPEVQMPPPATGKTLTAAEKELLTQWIASGAPWQEHWSFITPTRPSLPQPVGISQWGRNPIDHFILAQLNRLGLKPNPPAALHHLARRAALDLTGLPAAPAVIRNLPEHTDPATFDTYIDGLLTSPHAGEHRARYWLDAARYGDTHGMHVDNYREIWPYRDWVVDAFNSNLPFDQFVRQQLAGDLLPGATLQQRIATGFNRCNITTSEGGAIPAELDVRYMVDRVETTSTVFLGLTTGCAVCHDHKYDPISQAEFYQLGAFFNNTTQPAMDGNQKDTPPVVAIPGPEYQAEWQALQTRRATLQTAFRHDSSKVQNWWAAGPALPEHPVGSDGLEVWLPLTQSEGTSNQLPGTAQWSTDHPAGRRGIRFGDRGQLTSPLVRLKSDQPLTVSFWFRTPDTVLATTLFSQQHKEKDGPEVGWKITGGSQGAVTFELTDAQGKKIRGNLPDNEALTPRSWQHVCVRYSGGQANSSISILVNGRAGNLRNSSEQHCSATELVSADLKIGGPYPSAGMSDVRVFRRWLLDEEVQLLADEHQLRECFARAAPWDQLSAADRQRLDQHFHHVANPAFQTAARGIAETETRRDFIYARSTTTLVMQERPTAPRAEILERGDYTRPLAEVQPAVPAVLPPLPTGATANRLGLADWLVHPDHPLTARVTINRLWQSLFGTGLVRTAEDFGVMGDTPTHPQLLDYLAVEFVESGWDVKHMLKMMVTSATYQQSSLTTPAKLDQDPQNRFLSRGPRLRLDAEVLRDQALAVSGLLSLNLGGPSVRPYQPAGLWKVVAITGSNTREFKQDEGEALYRRSLYTFWKRTSPPPSMAAFNAPTREQCTVRRERTNTPLQALVLMNDPQFVEAARHLAQRALAQHQDITARATWMLQEVGCRGDQSDVTDTVSAAVELGTLFRADTAAASSLIATGSSKPDPESNLPELAAWTMIANLLLNRDDIINK